MGIPDEKEASKEKKDVVMPTLGAKSDMSKKAADEEKENQSKIEEYIQ